MEILIDPRFMFDYASYYIIGLQEFYGKKNIHYSFKEFNEVSYDYYRIMCYKILNNGEERHIVIDYQDSDIFVEDAYQWCDVYAKINVKEETVNLGHYKKLLCITPGFGVKTSGLLKTCFHAVLNTLYITLNGWHLYGTKKEYICSYITNWHNRYPLYFYTSKSAQTNDYIYFISTLWEGKECELFTNNHRAQFIRICKSIKKIHFEGGLFAKRTNMYYNQYKDIIFENRYPQKTYIKKMKRSIVTFNVPSISGCHGWKLGEFLAMGKAIISMPLTNYLIYPLTDGVDIYFVKDKEEMSKATKELVYDEKKRSGDCIKQIFYRKGRSEKSHRTDS